MSNKKPLAMFAAISFALGCATAEAAGTPPPSVAGTSWSLTGKLKGTAKAKCQIGGTHAVPISSKVTLSATIDFDDGDVVGDNEGAFVWTDATVIAGQATGQWQQDGANLELNFDHWYDSPLAVFAFGFAQVPPNFDFSQAGVNGSASGLQLTKFTITGKINKPGTKIQIAESLGFKFDAAASALGSANACTFSISNLGRKYKGVPAN